MADRQAARMWGARVVTAYAIQIARAWCSPEPRPALAEWAAFELQAAALTASSLLGTW